MNLRSGARTPGRLWVRTGVRRESFLKNHYAEMAYALIVQDAAYSTLLRSRPQQIHATIATNLEGAFPEIVASQPEVLAQHLTEAGIAERAVSYWLKAGQQAIARCAMVFSPQLPRAHDRRAKRRTRRTLDYLAF
jgi:hypothetical protein